MKCQSLISRKIFQNVLFQNLFFGKKNEKKKCFIMSSAERFNLHVMH